MAVARKIIDFEEGGGVKPPFLGIRLPIADYRGKKTYPLPIYSSGFSITKSWLRPKRNFLKSTILSLPSIRAPISSGP